MTSEFRPDSDSESSTLETLTHRRLVPNELTASDGTIRAGSQQATERIVAKRAKTKAREDASCPGAVCVPDPDDES